MLLFAVSVLVVAQSSSEIPEGLMNNPEYYHIFPYLNNEHYSLKMLIDILADVENSDIHWNCSP